MPKLDFGLSSYQRARGDLPELPVINMFAEETPTEEKGIILQSRPGLEETGTVMGDGPVVALFQKDGVLGAAQFAISDGALYENGVLIGAVDGPGPFFIDGYQDRIFIAGGASLWTYDGTLSAVPFPDGADVLKVVVGASRALCLRADTEQWYWSDVLGDDVDALSFASAESQPDLLRDILFLDDKAILFGAETVEQWPNTQDADLPFAPLEGVVFEVGVRNTGAATAFGNSFAWVTNHNRVCVGDENSAISNEGLEAKIKASSECRLWTFFIDSVQMLALTLDDETHAFSARSGKWSQMVSHGFDNWVPCCFAADVFGSSVDGRTMAFSEGWEDLGGVLERRIRAGFPLNSGGATIDNLILRANVGNTGYLVGTYADPSIELRSSKDVGRTWGNWKRRSLGEQGQYRKRVSWRSLGQFRAPGAMFELRVTDPIDVRISDVLVNEPY